ncbi:GPP34 family phosphoprotein [Ornithinimicrobium faecis]|uniref:GPP34 family phosphoprotein n=1 Tax=Ornithinimicrobium faecis TaxID=2934158 RepID=A0ABY4YUE9_9MICO|nr:GPP34 family phosphoprotein [Ornithinimicrobium sp. HY1793]USQ80392.1 GPP34 family phosphoprotein [Ornithinimicrobium sp. HY1793]
MSLLLAEELTLLCLDDETGQALLPHGAVAEAVASALVFELTLRSTLKRSGKRLERDTMVTIRDDLLSDAADRVDGLSVDDAIQTLSRPGTLETLLHRLASLGALTDPDVWTPGPHWPTGPRADAPVRSRLEEILVRDADPTQREAVLISLLEQLGLTTRLLPHADQGHVGARAAKVAGSARPLRNRPATATPGSLAGHLLDLVLAPGRWLR